MMTASHNIADLGPAGIAGALGQSVSQLLEQGARLIAISGVPGNPDLVITGLEERHCTHTVIMPRPA